VGPLLRRRADQREGSGGIGLAVAPGRWANGQLDPSIGMGCDA
jgi:hypothetical protein